MALAAEVTHGMARLESDASDGGQMLGHLTRRIYPENSGIERGSAGAKLLEHLLQALQFEIGHGVLKSRVIQLECA